MGRNKEISDLYRHLSPERRAKILGRIADRLEEGLEEAIGEEPRKKLMAARDAAQTLDLMMGLSKRVTDEEEAIMRLVRAAAEGPQRAPILVKIVEASAEDDPSESQSPPDPGDEKGPTE